MNQPYINITLDRVKIQRPRAAAGAVAFIERALQFEILNSQIQDINAQISSLIISQSDKFTLNIFRTSVICDSNYDPIKKNEGLKS